MSKYFHRLVSTAFLLAVASGCGSSTLPPDRDPNIPPPPEGIKTQVLLDKQVRVLYPTVEFDGGIMNISGFVRRKAGVSGMITGRVDIEILDDQGQEIDWFPALLTPTSIPTTGRAEASYLIHYGWIPPVGSTIKVYFVDSKTAVIEDTSDDDSVGGKYGIHTGGRAGGHAGRH